MPIKVIHITASDSGGAGLAVLRIHRALLACGVDSRVLVMTKRTDDPLIYQAHPIINKPIGFWLLPKAIRWCKRHGMLLTDKERWDREQAILESKSQCSIFTTPISDYDLAEHPIVKEADIIHLHWIANFVDFRTFFGKVHKPIVWTLHDENIVFGGFHYQREYDLYAKEFQPLEKIYSSVKQKAILNNSNIHIVALSSMMRDFVIKHTFLAHCSVDMIHNCVEADVFQPIDKQGARNSLGIASESKVIAFCAYYLDEKRKGLMDLIAAVRALNDPKTEILCMGAGNVPEHDGIVLHTVGLVGSDKMASVLSAADLFAMPSSQEAFAQTPMEAMACGLPVVAYPCSGAKDLITEQSGVVCDNFTVEALVTALKTALSKKYDTKEIRSYVTSFLSPVKIANQYLQLYKKVLAK